MGGGYAPTEVADAPDVAARKTAYDKSCQKSHGGDGTPNPTIAKMMKIGMKSLSSKKIQGKSDAVLNSEKLEGVGAMKAIAISDGEAGACAVGRCAVHSPFQSPPRNRPRNPFRFLRRRQAPASNALVFEGLPSIDAMLAFELVAVPN